MMAKNMVDGEFWLPSDFLADDFFLEGEVKNSSPVESATETESDEDDYIAGLTRQMAHSFLHEDDKNYSVMAKENPKVMATSPQSTLCGVGSWPFSSKGSPEGPSQVSSPPSTPFQQSRNDAALDLLYAAAGQVVRLGLNDENVYRRWPSAPSKNPANGLYSTPVLTQQQLQAAQFYQLKQQQLMKQQFSLAWGRQNRSRGGGGGCGGGGGYGEGKPVRPLGLSPSAWPPLQKQQPQPGSGMRAVFLNGSGARRESTGTGVFLPRRIGNANESRKKPARSTVLLPARVIQALNLNLDDKGVHPRLHKDAVMVRSNDAQPRRNPLCPRPALATGNEIRLPSEWTY